VTEDLSGGVRVDAGGAGRRRLVASLVGLSLGVTLLAGGNAATDRGSSDRGTLAPAVTVPPPASLDFPDAAPPAAVLSPARGTPPRPAALGRQLAGVLSDDDLGDHVGVLVEPLSTDRDLFRVGGADRFIPASTTKLLTTTAALQVMGPRHRFSTEVVRTTDVTGNEAGIVLVGGGDPLLTTGTPTRSERSLRQPATLAELAERTAAALRDDGVRRVRLGYDATLFTGWAASPHWKRSYIAEDIVSPITALWIDEGRVRPNSTLRHDDPALAAATSFARLLERDGIRLTGQPTPTRAGRAAEPVATVSSPPLQVIVEHVLATSDNEGAEALLRHTGLATGRPASFTGGVNAVRETLTALGVDLRRSRLFDGSGLSRDNGLTLETIADTLRVAAAPANPQLRRVVSGLPVAGFTGSLTYRFTIDADEGFGVVRAKTGTLSGVHALAGIALDRDGAPLIFVAVANGVDLVDTLDSRALLDQLAADLASCGCS